MLNISISHRSIKTIAITIAILILTAIAIPSLNGSPARAEIGREIKSINPEAIMSPFKVTAIETDRTFDPIGIMSVGIDEIDGKKFAWAAVLMHGTSGAPEYTQYFYLPSHRLQTLFESGLETGAVMTIEARLIEKPEGVDMEEDMVLYEVISAKVYRTWITEGL